ncbi:MAG TPA: SdrD B-like domain-containing protein [Thermoanaerobaculia bacterium]|nr:SdrD B-like domain-containing protein [Thermoanaerobaculia bacterium]
MLSKKIFVILTLLLSLFAIAQEASAAEPAVLSTDLRTWTINTVAGLPDKNENGYLSPNATELAAFRSAVQEFLAESWSDADDLADAVGYEVVELHDTGDSGEIVYVLRPEAGNTDGRGFFLVRPENRIQRRLVLQAPHPRADRETATLGVEIFRAGRARAFSFAGAHRCTNIGEASPCAGNSDACDGATSYRISDMAHNDDTFFEVYNEETANEAANTVTLQLHGHGDSSPELSASDGSTRNVADADYLPNRLAQQIEDRMILLQGTPLPAPGNSCNDANDINFKCGTNNVQGRFINHSTDICQLDADPANGHFGRFVHLEMSHDLRDTGSDSTQRYPRSLVVDAVLATFPKEAEIGGRAWADIDGNGQQDSGEPGIDGVTVKLLASDDTLIRTETTGLSGGFVFTNLDEASYRVEVEEPLGYSVTGKDASGVADDADNDFDPTTRKTDLLSLGPSASLDVDAGLVPPGVGEIGDQVWDDANGDGEQDTSEPGVGGVTVRLIREDGIEIASTVTEGPASSAEGSFLFDNVLPGDYKLRFEAPGWGFTDPEAASVDLDSDVNPQTGETAVFPIGAGVTDLSRDAGLVANCLDVALVPFGSTWTTTAADSAISGWEQPSYVEDSGWTGRRQAPLGYESSSVGFRIGGVTAPAAPSRTNYFRHTFQVTDPALFQGLTLTLLRNDGAIVYLNGAEVLRSNLPEGAVGVDTAASSSSEATVTANLSSSLLVTGTNVLAVEVHRSASDSNIKLDLELKSRVCSPCRVQEVVLQPSIATHMEQDDPDDNDDTKSVLAMCGDPGDEESSLIKWQTHTLGNPLIPANAEVLHAEILATVATISDSNEMIFPMYPVLRNWTESGATWNQFNSDSNLDWAQGGAKDSTDRATANPAGLFSLPASTTLGQPVALPLNAGGRALVEQWIDNPTSNFGLILAASGPDGELEIHSDNSANKPRLRVIYLNPSCGQ